VQIPVYSSGFLWIPQDSCPFPRISVGICGGLKSIVKMYYVSSHLDLKEPELMIPIVALGATAISASFIVIGIITDAIIQVLCCSL